MAPGAGLSWKGKVITMRVKSGAVRRLKKSELPKDIRKAARTAKMQPLEYMLQVMNDPEAELARRDRMAKAAAPYCHPRVADDRVGKKDLEAEAARTAGGPNTDWGDDLRFEGGLN